MTDNGSQFTSEDFANFVKLNGIQHSLSSPYHPASNGEAERFVRTFKEAMKTSKNNGMTLAHRMNNFLLTYRTTPHSTTGTPPSELLMGHALHTRWDIIKPDVGQRVCWCQAKQKEGKDQNTKLRHFVMGQSVMVKNFLYWTYMGAWRHSTTIGATYLHDRDFSGKILETACGSCERLPFKRIVFSTSEP